MDLTDKQYQILIELFNEMPDCFWCLPQSVIGDFFNRLYSKM